MPRYYFDFQDGGLIRDEDGTECPDLATVRREVTRTLPRLAADMIHADGDQRTFTALVTDEDGKAVYAASLTYTGHWLLR